MDDVFSIDNAKALLGRLVLPQAMLGGTAPEIEFESAKNQALLVGSDVLSFDQGVESEFREAVSDTALLAQLAATHQLGQDPDPIAYFDAYFAIVGSLGWATQVRDTAQYELKTQGAEVHEAIIEVAMAFLKGIPGAAELVVLSLKSLRNMNQGSPLITLFERNSQDAKMGRFQFTIVRQDALGGGLFAEVMAFGLTAREIITQVLFFKLKSGSSTLRRSLGRMSLNRPALQALHPILRAKVATHLAGNVAALDIGD